MTEAYRNEQLANARNEADKARAAFDSIAKWDKAKRDAAESLEFWTNKTAFLGHAK